MAVGKNRHFKNMEAIKDWKGNEVKEGDEVCRILIKKGGLFNNIQWWIPDGKGNTKVVKVPDIPEADCWEVGQYQKVELCNGMLCTTTVTDSFTMTSPLSLEFPNDRVILAIKGISDTNPKQ